jgi:glycosyltransferase involved in cell wall biosynthesis
MKVLVLFPPKTKNSSKLYFRTGQLVESLQRKHEVTIIEGMSETGTTGTRKPAIVRFGQLIKKLPTIIRSVREADVLFLVPSPFWYGLLPLARLLKKPVVLDHFTTYLSHADYVSVPLLRWFDRKLYPQIAAVVTHTETMRQDLHRHYGYPLNRIFVLYSVVDTALFDRSNVSAAKKTTLRTQLGISPEANVAMYHGAAHPFHGLEVIKKAAEKLDKAGVTVLLVGDPEPATNRGPANIMYQPYVPFEELPVYLSLADVWMGRFTAATHEDPRGDRAASSCMFQAMAMALPIVTGETRENRYVLEDGADGILIKPGDAALLADTVLALLRDSNKRHHLGQKARKRIESAFTISEVDTVIEHLLAKASGD